MDIDDTIRATHGYAKQGAGYGYTGVKGLNLQVALITPAVAYHSVTAAITRIPEHAWTGIKYPQAIWEEAEQRWISEAEVAEISYTAFRSRRKDLNVTARLIVRRVTRLGAKTVPARQAETFSTHRHPCSQLTPVDARRRSLAPQPRHR